MKILLVTPLSSSSGDPHRFWFKALKELKQQVKIFPLNDFPQLKLIKSWQLGREIGKFQPEEIFFSGGIDAVFPLKNTVFFTGVAAKTLSSSERQTGIQAKLVVVNDPSHILTWKNLGAKKAVCLPISAIDPDYFKPVKVTKTIPVSFVGTLFPYRQQQLLDIIKLCPQLKIWGRLESGVEVFRELKPYYQGEAWGKQVVRIYRKSLIGLNLAPSHLFSAGNIRTFEIPACQALLLSNKLNPDWYLPGKEAVVFHNSKDCAKKINYYLHHEQERRALALSGYRRTLKDHTYKKRFQQLLKLL